MKNFFFSLILCIIAISGLFLAIGAIDGGADPSLPENQPTESAVYGPGVADLTGFEPAEQYGLLWDCEKSAYVFADVQEKQVITKSGDYLLFYCQLGTPLVKFAGEDEIAVNAGDGRHDYFIKK